MLTEMAGFDWDDGNRIKCSKHGVSLHEIEAVFVDGGQVAPDLRHSGAEARYIAIGHSTIGRWIFVAFTIRMSTGGRLIRPISARYMHAKEVANYVTTHS